MARTVWKFPLKFQDVSLVMMPRGATVLHVDVQDGVPCLRALVDPGQPGEARPFAICGTGHPAPDETEGSHVGTFLIDGGAFVFHVFERRWTPSEQEAPHDAQTR